MMFHVEPETNDALCAVYRLPQDLRSQDRLGTLSVCTAASRAAAATCAVVLGRLHIAFAHAWPISPFFTAVMTPSDCLEPRGTLRRTAVDADLESILKIPNGTGGTNTVNYALWQR